MFITLLKSIFNAAELLSHNDLPKKRDLLKNNMQIYCEEALSLQFSSKFVWRNLDALSFTYTET